MNTPEPNVVSHQQEILQALRSGAYFRTAHKEGGTTIFWQGGCFVREDYGDWSERHAYTEEAAFLAFLRRFFEWESRGPQRKDLPEAERWTNIRGLLWRDGRRQLLTNEVSPHWKATAFIIAAIAVGLVLWLRGGFPRSAPPQKLDSFNGAPPHREINQHFSYGTKARSADETSRP